MSYRPSRVGARATRIARRVALAAVLAAMAAVSARAAEARTDAPAASTKRAFTIRDLYRVRSVGDPAISPDGRRIALRVSSFDLEAGKANSDVYLIHADGTGVRRLTTAPGSDGHPFWSPDGEWLYFVSRRDGSAQIRRIRPDGGESEAVTDFAPGVQDPRIGPDGRTLFFVSQVFPECGSDSDCNRRLREDIDDGPVHAHLADDLFYRHWAFWRDGRRFHVIAYDADRGEYRDLTPGPMDLPMYVTGGSAGYDVSPDGREICVAGNPDPNWWETTNKDLFVVSVDGGERTNITDANEAYDGNPRYSPDGRYIAYLRQEVPGYESDRFRLALYDRRSGRHEVLTEVFDNWVEDFAWAPDSKSLFFIAAEEGARPVYRVDVRSRRIRPVVELRHIDAFDVSPDGRWLAIARRSVAEPREIWRCTTSGRKVRRLTTFNRALEDSVDLRPAEEMWIDAPNGARIHTFVVKPHGFDPSKRYPLILNVHGGPQSQWTDAFRGDWQVYPGAGYVVAFCNPHGSTGYGQAFTRAISRDWGGKVYEDIMAVTDALAELPWVDEDRMGAMGWSYGGYMMMWLEGHTTRFRAIAAMMGVYDLPAMWGATEELWFPQFDLGGTPWESDDYRRWSPHEYAQNFTTPCLVITGEKDFRVPYTQSLEFFTALRKRGVPARLIVFENDGHWPSWVQSMPVYYNAHLEWFHRWLGGGPAPWKTEDMVRNRAFGADAKPSDAD